MRTLAVVGSCLFVLAAGCGAQSPPREAAVTATAEAVPLNQRAIQLAEDDSFVEGFLSEEAKPAGAAPAASTGATAARAEPVTPAAKSGNAAAPAGPPPAGNGKSGLPPAVIQQAVKGNFGRFRLCYENGLRSNATLAGKVIVKFTIAADGRVGSATATGDLPDDGVKACVAKAFQGLSFPAPPNGGPVSVSYPIVFSPGA